MLLKLTPGAAEHAMQEYFKQVHLTKEQMELIKNQIWRSFRTLWQLIVHFNSYNNTFYI